MTSKLEPLMISGQRFSTSHPDWARNNITEVTVLGTHGTKSGNYFLLEGTRPDGTVKRINFSKAKMRSGRVDIHFEPILPSVELKNDTKDVKIS
jgi:hypothetical protein